MAPNPILRDQRLPILVGVTGSRRFSAWTNPHAGQDPRELFVERFTRTLDFLDDYLPFTPKVLVCGGAAGVDLAAAEIVLRRPEQGLRPGWSIVVMLAFSRSLFVEDFESDEFAGENLILQRLEAGAASGDRVAIKELRLLAREPFQDSRLDDACHPLYAPSELSRQTTDRDPLIRHRHYEQFGLWLSRYSTILIAATDDTVADPQLGARIGGSARVIAFRLAGAPDCDAQQTIDRSVELLTASRVEEPDGGYVLLIDPKRAVPANPDSSHPPVTVLEPIQRLQKQCHHEKRRSIHDVYRAPVAEPAPADRLGSDRQKAARLTHALKLAKRFDELHGRAVGAAHLSRRRGGEPEPMAAVFGPQAPADYLEHVRNGPLRDQEQTASLWTKWVLRLLVLLFLLAVVLFEIHIEIMPEQHSLMLAYVLVLFAIYVLSTAVRRSHVQVRAEDYRSLREMMRVQIAWWSAGIDRMVDRVHLRSADFDLGLVRMAGATASIWSLLRCSCLSDCDIVKLRPPTPGTRQDKRPYDWIQTQIEYFKRQSKI